MDPRPGRRVAGVERRGPALEPVEGLAQFDQHLAGVPGPDLAGVDEPVVLVVADEQGPEADAGPLRVGEPADHALLPAQALDLHPPPGPTADAAARQQPA